ncbi:MAG: radical SAM protein [Kofleriaceae bacterium]
MTQPRHRRRLDVVTSTHRPIYVVWELTLACDHACTHCGSRAGVARDGELSTEAAVAVAGQLADAGTREVVLIGGEAYLHAGFLDVVRALARRGVAVGLTTGGRGITPALAVDMKAAGLGQASVSIDGLATTHDRMRARTGSFDGALAALDHLRAAGIAITANTNLNRSNQADLESLYQVLKARGIVGWQLQLTAPLGRAADRVAMLLQPWDLLTLVPRVAALKQAARADGITLMPGNNLGYFGPEETVLRSLGQDDRDHWRGCQAGKYVMGIESDGAVKGCPSLQTAHYVGGNLRDQALADIWRDAPELTWNRGRTVDALWGFCRTCDFAEACLGGCTFTAHAILGRPGNNPYCHYRARTLAKRGVRERLVPATAAAGLPFDNGTFALIEEPLDAPDPAATLPGERLVQIDRRPRRAPVE